MNVNCADRERIFMDGSAAQWAALEAHATTCAECGEELRVWKSMTTAAGELRQEWETPHLWTRIERGLTEQMSEKPSRLRAWLNSIGLASIQWQTATALLVLVLVTGAAWRIIHDRREIEEHTSELQSPCNLVCRLLLEKKKN